MGFVITIAVTLLVVLATMARAAPSRDTTNPGERAADPRANRNIYGDTGGGPGL